MNVLKNMEAIFLVAAALATVSTYASAEIPEMRAAHKAQAAAQAAAQNDGKIAIVKIGAKRAA
jgi:hypothetical protein